MGVINYGGSMMKHKSFTILCIIGLAITLTIIGCGRRGSLNPNTPPYIEISEYSGIEKPDTLADSTFFEEIGSYIDPAIYDSLFYQVIYWRAYDEDGVISNFAYRIGTWDSDSSKWLYDQAYGIKVNEEGWVLHEQPNGEFSMWTPNPNKPYARVYFPSKDTTDFRKNFGKFEVICRDNRGEISNTAKKYFATYSEVPKTSITTSQGVIDSCRVGTAIRFKFTPIDEDPYGLGDEAAYYKYRLVTVPRIGAREDTLGKGFEGYEFGIGSEILDTTKWYSTEGFEKPDEVFLRAEYPPDDPYKDRKPLLVANELNELTQIQVKAVDKAGIEDPNYAKMTFFVRDYFRPETRSFEIATGNEEKNCNILPRIFVLGENHYLSYLEFSDDRPKKVVNGEDHFGTQFYYNKDGELTALWSNDIEIHLRWEYYGEYMVKREAGVLSRTYKAYTFHYDENLPTAFKIGEDLLLPEGYCPYYCEVEYMDIQLDSTVTNLPPLSGIIIEDEFGEWMRVPITQDQRCKLFGLSPGTHTFRVRAVDFQGAVDPTPATLEFNLVKMEDTKNGVLVIDDTPNDVNFSPEGEVDLFYQELLSNLQPTVYDIDDLVDISNLNSYGDGIGHQKQPSFAPSDLINYKLIIWHSNNPGKGYDSEDCHFTNHYNIFSLYLESGGNILFTGGMNLKDRTTEVKPFLEDYAGFSDVHYTMNRSIPYNLMHADFVFSQAEGLENYNDINVNLHLLVNRYDANIVLNPNFNDWEDSLPVGWIVPDEITIDETSPTSRKLIISAPTPNYVYQTIPLEPLELEDKTSCDSVKFKLEYTSYVTSGTYKIEIYDPVQEMTLREFTHDNTEEDEQQDFIQYLFIPTECDSIELRLWTSDSGAEALTYWDNLSLKFGYWMPEYFGATAFRFNGIGGITYFDLGEATPIYQTIHASPNAQGYIASKYAKPFANGKVGTTYILGFPLFYIQMDDAKNFINQVCNDIGLSY